MTKINSKEQFIEILQIQLLHLPEEQRIDILYDYEEHFQIGSERGEAEEEIIKKLGDPAAIAAQYRFEIADETEIGETAADEAAYSEGAYGETTYDKTTRGKLNQTPHLLKAVTAIIGAIFLDGFIVLGFYLTPLFLVISGFVSAITLLPVGISIILWVFYPDLPFVHLPMIVHGSPASAALLICIGIAVSCLGVILAIVFAKLIRFVYRGTCQYIKRRYGNHEEKRRITK